MKFLDQIASGCKFLVNYEMKSGFFCCGPHESIIKGGGQQKNIQLKHDQRSYLAGENAHIIWGWPDHLWGRLLGEKEKQWLEDSPL